MYKINEVFLSIQGEGIRSGTPNVFVRFANCNLKCTVQEMGFDCDTDFTGVWDMDITQLFDLIKKVGEGCTSIIFTGGEPMLQLDAGLLDEAQKRGYYCAVETNGTLPLNEKQKEHLDWITVSPKTAEHTIRIQECNELKYVVPNNKALPRTNIHADYYLLSPVFNGNEIDRDSLQWCSTKVKEDPKWRLSVQNHKFWKAR